MYDLTNHRVHNDPETDGLTDYVDVRRCQDTACSAQRGSDLRPVPKQIPFRVFHAPQALLCCVVGQGVATVVGAAARAVRPRTPWQARGHGAPAPQMHVVCCIYLDGVGALSCDNLVIT